MTCLLDKIWQAIVVDRCKCWAPMKRLGRCEDGGEHFYCASCDIHWSIGMSLDGWGDVWWRVDPRGRML